MNSISQAFIRGFVKAAANNQVDPAQLQHLLHQLNTYMLKQPPDTRVFVDTHGKGKRWGMFGKPVYDPNTGNEYGSTYNVPSKEEEQHRIKMLSQLLQDVQKNKNLAPVVVPEGGKFTYIK